MQWILLSNKKGSNLDTHEKGQNLEILWRVKEASSQTMHTMWLHTHAAPEVGLQRQIKLVTSWNWGSERDGLTGTIGGGGFGFTKNYVNYIAVMTIKFHIITKQSNFTL